MAFWYGSRDSRVCCGDYRVYVLYHFVHCHLIFFHCSPVNYWCISSLPYSVNMHTTPVLPLISIPPVNKIPLWYQYIVEKFLKSFVEEPGCYVWVFDYVLLSPFGCFCLV